jgi:acetoin utilization protein AcuA
MTARIAAPQGWISLYSNCPPGFFGRLKFDTGIGDFDNYSSIIQKLDEFEKIATTENGRVSIALLEPSVVVGYFACAHPKSDERWSKLGTLMYEFKAVEVSRNFRKCGLAARLIKTIVSESFIEDKIAYMNGYSWHWDMVGSGYAVDEYRKVHLQLLLPYSFQEVYTNEPNINLRLENIFMARIGARVSDEDRRRFKRLTLGIMT